MKVMGFISMKHCIHNAIWINLDKSVYQMNKCIKDNYPEWAWNEPRMTDNDRTSEAPVTDWTTNPSVLSADRNMKNRSVIIYSPSCPLAERPQCFNYSFIISNLTSEVSLYALIDYISKNLFLINCASGSYINVIIKRIIYNNTIIYFQRNCWICHCTKLSV